MSFFHRGFGGESLLVKPFDQIINIAGGSAFGYRHGAILVDVIGADLVSKGG